MNSWPPRSGGGWFGPCPIPARPPGLLFALFLGAWFWADSVRAQLPDSEAGTAHSVSGQIVVTSVPGYSPLFSRRNLVSDDDYVRLEPALLAVSAERFKVAVWRQLGVGAGSAWQGRIFLVLHPAQSLDDGVVIAAGPILRRWVYRVSLPDVVARTRYARALTTVTLLELANRGAGDSARSDEVPAWLADGLAETVLGEDTREAVLSAPGRSAHGLPQSTLAENIRGLDPLAFARQVLQSTPPLTFDEMDWPADRQVNGDDGGVYLASAELFVHELLGLERGPEKMRVFLAGLPAHLNWQTAFFAAFHDNFNSPLEVEKWWALRAMDFAARNAGPRGTTVENAATLARTLSVPALYRGNSNALPEHVEISLQDALKNFSPATRDAVLRTRVRDLELARYRLGPPFSTLADSYRRVLVDFLGADANPPPKLIFNKHPSPIYQRAGLAETLKKLDVLDARFRAAETRVTLNLSGQSPGASR